MLKIYKRNGESFAQAVTIRPTPLISISHTPQKNKMGTVGCIYTISLAGTIIAHDGSPTISSVNSNGNIPANGLAQFTDTPTGQNIDIGDRLKSISLKQNKLRELFANDGNKIEISSLSGATSIVFVPNFVSIDFEEGIYIETCRYTINLETSLLFDVNGNVYTEALMGSTFSPNAYDTQRSANFYLRETTGANKRSINDIINRWGGIVEDFSDTWSIETDESNGQTPGSDVVPLSYIATRNMSATGKMFYGLDGKKNEAWEQAVGFIKKTLLQEPNAPPNENSLTASDQKYKQYPGYLPANKYSNGFLNLPSFYQGYNHVRTFNVDKTAGSCSVSETWLLASGQSHLENYTIGISRSVNDPIVSIKIDGNITGLSNIHASGYHSQPFDVNNSPYGKALLKYNNISNNGSFGPGSVLYTRAANIANQLNIALNPKPLSSTLGSNENAGTITYSLEFNNRPCNFFNGVIAENINISDNYPGDVFAVIPVLGRRTGPILQYIKGRTEYSRNVDIELILDYQELKEFPQIQGLPPSSIYDYRTNLVLNKPSLNNSQLFPFRSQLENLVGELSPRGEPNVIKYFLKPPTETWSPKDGRYTLNLSWDYEKSI
jgi:hypothetical protein